MFHLIIYYVHKQHNFFCPSAQPFYLGCSDTEECVAFSLLFLQFLNAVTHY
uniref:Uncharacterized protein n=1 Tax=Lepeophtheirus salmonis TaxID=72036 RepID=A0A0K2T909_LEPSM